MYSLFSLYFLWFNNCNDYGSYRYFRFMNIYALLTPLVLLLLLAEILYSHFSGKKLYSFQDTIANLGTGIGNQCVNLAVAYFVFKFYGFLYQFAPYKFEVVWYNFILLLVLQDFVFYWFHRVGHSINIFWAAHMPHHSSEEMNLSVGLRASFTQRIFQFAFFDWVFPLMGFSPEMVYSVAAVHLLLAYWHHTKAINKMGWIGKVFVVPSHHRVHHGVNTQYLDKNFSEVFIFWDKLFGTYAPEEEPVCYGVTKPPQSWDPILINIQFWKHLWDDAVAAPYFIDKIRVWFMPLGWRPRDIGHGHIPRIGYNTAEQVKYSTNEFPQSRFYLVVQVVVGLLLLYVAINQKLPIELFDRIFLSVTIVLMIVSWSRVLEGKANAMLIETIRLFVNAIALGWVFYHSFDMPLLSWQIATVFLVFGLSMLWATFIQAKRKSRLV